MENKRVEGSVAIENATLAFRNFSGKGGDFNPEGSRNFVVFLDQKQAAKLKLDGWNVKELKPRDNDEDQQPQPYLQVKVNFSGPRPPKIVMVTPHGKQVLNESDVNILDWANIESADVEFVPYNWSMRGSSGVTAYLKTLYVVLAEDRFESKYEDVPDSAANTITFAAIKSNIEE